MNIVFVIDNYNNTTDGTIVTARRFQDELERQGHNVRVVSYGVEGENKFGLKEHVIPIVSRYSKKFNITYAKFDKEVMKKAFVGADLVHLFLPFQVQRKSMKLAREMGIPVSTAFHLHPDNVLKNAGIKNPRFLTKFLFWYFRKRFYDKATDIHCPSAFTAEELKKHHYKARLHIISNGVSSNFVPIEKPAHTPYSKENPFQILMIGRLAAEKRQDLLIDAVAASKYRDSIQITFAGNGPQEKRLKERAKKLPNAPRFAFLKQDALLKTIHASDLYVHAADVEIEGISCIEAISAGLVPVIGNAKKSATKQFAIREESVFEAGNAESLREKIEFWYEHPAELQVASRQYAEYAKQYGLSACVEKTVNMFCLVITDAVRKKDKHPAQNHKGTPFGAELL